MIILAIDYGDVRTGLAICDKKEILATPYKVLEHKKVELLIKDISEIVKRESVEHIVLGLPKNMDSSLGFRAQKSLDLASLLKEATGLEVEFWDERLTTVSAHKSLNTVNLRGKKRKSVVDALAASIILQDYLDNKRIKNNRGFNG